MRRTLTLLAALLTLAACGAGRAAPAEQCVIVQPDRMIEAGAPLVWRLTCTIGQDVQPGGALLVQFPHSYYSSHPKNWLPTLRADGSPPTSATAQSGQPLVAGYAKKSWRPNTLVFTAPAGLPAGDRVELTLGATDAANPSRAPIDAIADFRPLVLVKRTPDRRWEEISLASGVAVVAGPPQAFEVIAPSQARRGEAPAITVRLLDRFGNIAPPTKALRVKIGKTWVDFAAGDAGWKRVAGPRLTTAGVARLTATAPGAKGAVRSNPILVTDDEPETRWLWGDMQGHSARSDGEGTPEAYFDFAAGPGALDFAALTDHEWQLTRDDWRALQGLCAGRERAGEFVPLLAWEYSPGGHRIVYYPDCAATPDIPPGGPKRMWQVEYNDEPLVSWSRDAAGRPLLDYGDFHDIYRQLAGSGALAIPHTTSSWEMGNDWDAHVAAMTPLVEIYSAHGSSEADDSPRMLYDYLSSGSVRTALERGDRLGFIGSSDCHDGKPGRTLWGPWPGGLTALGAPRLDRASIWTSLRERRVYATTGARILLAFTAAGASMGQTAVVGQAPEIRFEVHGTDAIQRVEIVSRGQVIRSFSPAGTDFSGVFRDDAFPGYAYYYLRVTQRDGAMAWASPVWVFSPGVPRVERFSAQPADGRVRLRWDGGPGPAAGWYEVWRRRGNDGGGRVERYQRLAAIPPNPGVNVFADANPPPRGIAAYYLLRWMRADGPPLTIGLVAAEQLAEVTATVRGFVIPYFVEEPGAATIVIRDLNRTEMRRFEQRHDAPGAFEIAWDGRDAHGQPCRGLHFYEVSSGGITTPRRPIRLPN